ncbi:sulfotransferase family 2 domain-containing protein [Solicola gregarius]|uniref:Sulfotransferase family protein n=1 Tax=Solicola gregarius TaxID=2908642 RepID=A0AA46YLI1_9ACTN|nr:sulfotransferase family 2 domain-containing protein [Solicola gregarius]UYM06975.1 sulfotransferase family protein [Solicola gregarius]
MSASLTSSANALNGGGRRPRHVATAATYVVPELRIAYVTNLKAACSTVKWLIADLTGQDRERLFASTGRRPTRAQTIHDRKGWVGVSHLADHSDLSQLSADNGWLVFTLVRDPRARLWSAWQSKLLAGNPNFLGRVVEQPWYPRIPHDPSDVIEDFQRFVEAFAAERRRMRRIGKDGHFRPQSDLVYTRGLSYTHVYDIGEIPTFERDLAAHLVEVGHNALPSLRKDNDTPLKLTKDVLAGGVAEAIEDVIYREDFDRFGEAWEDGPSLLDGEWSEAAFVDLAFRREAHRRIRDLSDTATRLAREKAALAREAATRSGTDSPDR